MNVRTRIPENPEQSHTSRNFEPRESSLLNSLILNCFISFERRLCLRHLSFVGRTIRRVSESQQSIEPLWWTHDSPQVREGLESVWTMIVAMPTPSNTAKGSTWKAGVKNDIVDCHSA